MNKKIIVETEHPVSFAGVARLIRGLSQNKMSDLVGCAPNTIGRMERGEQASRAIVIAALVKLLGGDPDDEIVADVEQCKTYQRWEIRPVDSDEQ